MRSPGIVVFLLVIGLGGPIAAERAVPVPEVPPEFHYVGTYKLIKRVKIRSNKTLPIAIPSVAYLVFSDGITLRFYGESGGTSHTSFDIYRSDGVVREKKGNVRGSVPGVQARSVAGQILRQVTLTGRTMTLTKFPPMSDTVEITYAARVSETTRWEASNHTMNP